MNELIQLFTVFARIGAVTFGGGYAMLPILQAEVVEKIPLGPVRKNWRTIMRWASAHPASLR